ncbi:PREDICTED: uncharacterized protein LOC108768653 [Trachymyrmex cornetzi]|uniref:uncharacterized protein LOC108768653 n=1 Tax=Trachymyrmex cornetzi TaxID=471704 RepID=UPI00084F0EBE|nr:PREDICTED: uncharacterized protein LOC108768653 [Trachymyrmex cornetzi]
MLTGPIVQNDLFDIIMQFRTHKVVFTADVQQMYRQFLINKEDRPFQRILWRDSQEEPLRIFELNTVTYGTMSAPFLATWALLQLTKKEQHRFPRGAEVISRDMYVDNLLSEIQSLEQALQLKEEIIQLLQSGGLVLRKWISNDTQFMQSFTHQNNDPHLLLNFTKVQKTLGIGWIPQQDLLVYRINLTPEPSKITKRVILSQIATLIDPLGLLDPIIVAAKIFLSPCGNYILAGMTWCLLQWNHIRDELPIINQLAFTRQICISDPINVQLHAFADASEAAYGACIFLRPTNKKGSYLVNLVCSKSRVAPLKRISFPRLELCAALLLSRLFTAVRDTIGLPLQRIILWSDSTIIVLQWIQTPPHRLKTFVANRITKIQQHTKHLEWRHVPSNDNPADIISRVLTPKQLMKSHLWKHGPPWLGQQEENWPNQERSIPDISELQTFISSSSNNDTWTLHCFSTIDTLQRIIAWCYRFIRNS